MDEAARKKRNTDRLAECYPAFGQRLGRVLAAMEKAGFRPRIQEAYRSPADQLAAFNSGHSKLKFGLHNVTGAGGRKEALASDVLDDDNPLSPPTRYLIALAVAARAQGLETGILWGLPANLKAATDAAVRAKNPNAQVKVGWDPTHVQVSGISAAAARAGARPGKAGGAPAKATAPTTAPAKAAKGTPPPAPRRVFSHPPVTSGPDVKQFQQRMVERGWRKGWDGGQWGVGRKIAFKADGNYGPVTRSICCRFQQEKGLPVTGKVDKATWNAAWTAPVK